MLISPTAMAEHVPLELSANLKQRFHVHRTTETNATALSVPVSESCFLRTAVSSFWGGVVSASLSVTMQS